MSDNTDLYIGYTHLVARHKKDIWRLCWRYCRGNTEQCRDLMQDVALVLWTRLDRLRDNATPKEERQWVILTTRSVLHNLHRRPHIDATTITDALADQLANDDTNAQVSETLQELIAWLNPEDRTFVKDYLFGYQRHELAVKYNISPNAVNKRMQRIVQKLKTIKDKLYSQPQNK